MRKEHKYRIRIVTIMLALFTLSINISAQNIPKELSFVMPEMSFPSTNIMGFLNLPYLGDSNDNSTWYHSNGNKANYGDTWYHANGSKANYGDTWYHANGSKANYGDTWYHANGSKANYGDVWYHANGDKVNY